MKYEGKNMSEANGRAVLVFFCDEMYKEYGHVLQDYDNRQRNYFPVSIKALG